MTPELIILPDFPNGCEMQSSTFLCIAIVRPMTSIIEAPRTLASYMATPNLLATTFPKSPTRCSMEIPGQPCGTGSGE